MQLLQQRTKILIAEKHWETASGIGITDEMQVTIAGQAALMLLGLAFTLGAFYGVEFTPEGGAVTAAPGVLAILVGFAVWSPSRWCIRL